MAQTQSETGIIAAFFENSTSARQAVQALHEAGFSSTHIGVAHRGSYGTSTGTAGSSTSRAQTKTKEEGFSTWDKVKHWFAGDEPEPYADERRRGDLATHEIIDPETTSGYASSDLDGSFRNLEIPEDRSRYFAHRLRRGTDSAVVTVKAGGRLTEAENILVRYGGDLANNAATYDYGETTTTGTANAQGTTDTLRRDYDRDYDTDSVENIQLLGEVLRVHKDRVNRGEVRIRKEVVTENQTVQVPVTREELVIERRPVNETTAASGTISESEIRVPLSEERASLDKSTVVREEVSVGKRPVEEVRDVSGEVRHEELVVDDNTRKDDPNRRVA